MAVPVERRRSPRVNVGPNQIVHVELRHRVRMMDISQTGALFACDVGLPVGSRAQLRTGLASTSFSTEIVVKRQDERPAVDRRTALGATFTTMDEESRRGLEEFLRRASE